MESFALVIFGITGNLAQIKLIPALYDMAEKGLLPENMSIIGISRQKMTKEEFRKYFHSVLHLDNIHHRHEIKKGVFEDLCKRLYYLEGNVENSSFYSKLKNYLNQLTKEGKECNNRMYYFATYPNLYQTIFANLQKQGLNKENGPLRFRREASGWVRLIIEKPVGEDLKSARQLNELLLKYFNEKQIFRLDHYLGKETLQNILTFRFANGIFEPLINKDYIDHIQITASEDFGIGMRGGYYNKMGALKDVGQNHQLQMLAFATMDAPVEFSNEAVAKERLKILKNLVPQPSRVVFGQYEGYTKEANVDPKSNTDTFYAFKTNINSIRFKNVPIYIRAGKKLAQTVTEISIIFKTTTRLFKNHELGSQPNVLIYRIQPNEGIVLKILTKKPGHDFKLEPEYMQFCYKIDPKTHYVPDPYEKLLSDTIRGDQTFFNDSKEVEAQWAFIDPLANARGKPSIYKPGSWGPKEADELLRKDGKAWLEPSLAFCRF